MAASAGALGSFVNAAQGSIVSPALPVFNVRNFGAVGNGKTLDSDSINRAINACSAAGGGIVYVPPGIYLCGSVVLQSNVTFYLEAAATILGSTKLSDYSGDPNVHGDANSRHLIFARDAENVCLAGTGIIDGQGPSFWVPSDRKPLPPEDAWRDVAAYVHKALPRPSPLIEFYNCRNLRIEDVRIHNSPGWTLRPINCDNVFIRGVEIKNPITGSNTDGIDVTCCQNVFISDCTIDTGDDCICLKSESPAFYSTQPPRVTKNVIVTNCILTTCCNGFKFGTATRGGYENITFSNSVIYNDDATYPNRVISGLDIAIVDGGSIDGVVISNIRMQRVRTPIFIRRGNRRPAPDGNPGTVRGIQIDNIHAGGSILTSSITGLPGFPVEDVSISNVRIDTEEPGLADWTSREIPEEADKYPESRMFGRLPAHGFYVRHVDGLRLRNIDISATKTEARPVIVCDDVANLEIDGLRSTSTIGSLPTVKLIQTRRAMLRNCVAPPKTTTFLAVEGNQSERIVLMSSDLTDATKTHEVAGDVPSGQVVLGSNLPPTT